VTNVPGFTIQFSRPEVLAARITPIDADVARAKVPA